MFRPVLSLMARLCAGVLLCFFANQSSFGHVPDGSQEYRAFWVDAFGTSVAYRTPEQVSALINDARAANINTLIVQIRKRGDAYYLSNFEPKSSDVQPGFDPLADLIAKAHDTSAGPRIEIHAWIVSYPIWNGQNTIPSQANHPYRLHPDWLSKNDSGALWDGSNYTLDPGHPEVQRHNFNVCMDIISRYDIDGFNFDYIRYKEGGNWGYNDVAVARFNEQYDRTGKPAPDNEEFRQFRRDQVTALVRKVYLHTMETKPHVKISLDAITFLPSVNSLASWQASSAAYTAVYQDWRGWLEEGIIDLAIPMMYLRQGVASQAAGYVEWGNFAKDQKHNRHVILGPGLYLNFATNAIKQMRMSRDPSPAGNYAQGVSGYDYELVSTNNIVPRSTFLSALTQPGVTDQNGNVLDPNPTPIFAQPATIPPMPWKVSPTKGHIKGFVFGGDQIFDGAIVTLIGAVKKTMTNDATGFFGFVDLPPGNYIVRATAPGYGMAQTVVSVSAGLVTNAGLHLKLTDDLAPKIWDVQVSNVNSTSATITWRTDERGDSTVEFGTTTGFGTSLVKAALVKNHSIVIPNLKGSTGYYFRVKSRDAIGNESVSDTYGFMTFFEGFSPDIIIDNPQAKVTGTWSTGSGAPDKYGTNYRFKSAGTGSASLEYRPNFQSNGVFAVYAWHPQGTNRAVDAPYIINFDGGSTTVLVNQQTNGGQWNFLGEYNFKAGTNGFVKLTDAFTGNGGLQLMADAVRFASVPPPVDVIVDNTQAEFLGSWNTSSFGTKYGEDYNYSSASSITSPTALAVYTPNIVLPGKYGVLAHFPGNGTRSSRVPVTISYSGGTLTTNVDQTSMFVGWRRIASGLDFAVGTNSFVFLANNTGESASRSIAADAFRFSLAPTIALHPIDRVVMNGGSATFSVEAVGGATLQYQWRRNGGVLSGKTEKKLTLTNLTFGDDSQITVDVSNDAGTVTSLPATLTVKLAEHPQFALINRLPDGRFEFYGSGDNGTYMIDVSTNLVDWTQVSQAASTQGVFSFTDIVTNLPARFYRMRWVP